MAVLSRIVRARRMSDRRILIDCTATAASGVNTGIQRVVRNIVRCASVWAQHANVSVLPVSFDGRHFQLLPPTAFATTDARRPGLVPKRRLHSILVHGRRIPLLRATLLSDSTISVARRLTTDARWQLRAWRSRVTGRTGLAYGPRDWIVLLDSNWHADLRPELTRARSSGTRICVVVYDLIHVRHP